jgi:hypothetical protein
MFTETTLTKSYARNCAIESGSKATPRYHTVCDPNFQPTVDGAAVLNQPERQCTAGFAPVPATVPGVLAR